MATRSGRGEVPLGLQALLMAAYVMIGQAERAVELFRAQLAGSRHPHAFTRTGLVIGLKMAGFDGEAMAAATGLIDAAEARAEQVVEEEGLQLLAWVGDHFQIPTVGVAVDPSISRWTASVAAASAGRQVGPPDDRRTTLPGCRLHRLVPQPANAR
jgi:hypothetical protein